MSDENAALAAPSPTRVVSLEVQNVLRLKALKITPAADDNVVVLAGDNEAGKTSVLRSIAMALGGGDEIPALPLRRGQRRGYIIADLGDIIIERTFTAAGGGELVVKSADGTKLKRPQEILDRLYSKVAFDPLSFIRKKATDQLEDLRKVVGLDFRAIDAEKKTKFDERTAVNREIDRLRAVAASMPVHPDAPAQELVVVELLAELDKTNAANTAAAETRLNASNARTAVSTKTAELSALTATAKDLERELVALQHQLAAAKVKVENHEQAIVAQKAQADKLTEAAKLAVNLDVVPIRAKISEADATNRKVRDNAARAKALLDFRAKESEGRALTSAIDALESKRSELIAGTKFPIDGLGFGENGVTLNSIPFEQASHAQQLRAAVAISAKLSPGLKVILVEDGAFLDKKSRVLLEELAKEFNLQIWLEVCDVADKEATVVISDGEIAGASPEAVTAAETPA